ncbi:MAG: hypothetical protein DRP93_08430, partial [Candidatus Neomarinimicrobiota bacterium]
MAVQNPVMDIINRGGASASNSFSAATRAGAMANSSFQKGASMALKMDQLLQQQEAKLYNRQQQAEKNMQNALQRSINNQFKREDQAFKVSESKRLQGNWDTNRQDTLVNRAQTQENWETTTANTEEYRDQLQTNWNKTFKQTTDQNQFVRKQNFFKNDLTVKKHNLTVQKAVMAQYDKLKATISNRSTVAAKNFDQLMKLSKSYQQAGLNGTKGDTAESKYYKKQAEQYIGAMVSNGSMTKGEAAQLGKLLEGPVYSDYKLPGGNTVRIANIPEDAFGMPSTITPPKNASVTNPQTDAQGNTVVTSPNGTTIVTAPNGTQAMYDRDGKRIQGGPDAQGPNPVPNIETNIIDPNGVNNAIGGIDTFNQAIAPNQVTPNGVPMKLEVPNTGQGPTIDNALNTPLEAQNYANVNWHGKDPQFVLDQTKMIYKDLIDKRKGNPALIKALQNTPITDLLDVEGVSKVLSSNKNVYDPQTGQWDPNTLSEMIKPGALLDVYSAIYSNNDSGGTKQKVVNAVTDTPQNFIANNMNDTASRNKLFATVGWDKDKVASFIDRQNALSKQDPRVQSISTQQRNILMDQASANRGQYEMQPEFSKGAKVIASVAKEDSYLGDMARSILPDWMTMSSGKADDTKVSQWLENKIQDEVREEGYSRTETVLGILGGKDGKKFTDPNWITSNKFENTSAEVSQNLEKT